MSMIWSKDMNRDEMRKAVYDAAYYNTGDEDIADAVAGSVMGDYDEGMSEASFWDLVQETIECHVRP